MVFTDNGSQFVENLKSSRENGNFNIPRRLLCIPSQMEKSKRAGYWWRRLCYRKVMFILPYWSFEIRQVHISTSSSVMFTKIVAMFVKNVWQKNFLFVEKAIIYFAKTQARKWRKQQGVYVLQHVLWLVKYISYVVFDWLTKMIFSHVKLSYFLRVFKYDFSQWPKTLYNTVRCLWNKWC